MRLSSQIDHPQVPGLLRHLAAQQLLHHQRPAQVHVHPGQVIDAVGVGDPLPGRQVLADLLRAAVQVADVRRDLGDHLAVGPQHQPQHAVRAGMLRTHVDQHLVAATVEFDQLGIRAARVAMPYLPGSRDIRWASGNPCAADGRPSRRARGCGANRRGPRTRCPIRSKTSRSCQLAVLQTRGRVGNSGKRPPRRPATAAASPSTPAGADGPGWRGGTPPRRAAATSTAAAFLASGLEIVDAADAVQHVEAQLGLVAQPAADLRQRGRRDLDPRIDRVEVAAGDGRTEFARPIADESLRISITSDTTFQLASFRPATLAPVARTQFKSPCHHT